MTKDPNVSKSKERRPVNNQSRAIRKWISVKPRVPPDTTKQIFETSHAR